MPVKLQPPQVQDIASRIGLSQAGIDALQQKAQSTGVTFEEVRSIAQSEGKAAQFDQHEPSFVAVLGSPVQGPASVDSAPVRGVFAALVASKQDDKALGAKREKTLNDIVASFDRLAYVKTSADLFGIEDARHIVNAPKGTFAADLVTLAKEVVAHPDLVALADWTHPNSGLHSHDRTNVKEEYGRAAQLVKERVNVSAVCDHLLKNFDSVARNVGAMGDQGSAGAIERQDLEAEIKKLTDAGSPLAATLGMVLDGKLTPWPAACDLISVLANASGNTAPDNAHQLVTREGIQNLKTLVTGGDLSVRDREGARVGDRSELVQKIIANFDALNARGGVYVGPGDIEEIASNPTRFPAELVDVAGAFAKNSDLMSLADWIEPRMIEGQGTSDRLTEKGQYERILTLLSQRKAITAGLDHLIDNYEQLGQPLTRAGLGTELTKLANGGDNEKWLAAALQTKMFDNRYGVPVDFVDVLLNASGNNNAGGDGAAITFESLHQMREILNRAERGKGVREVDFKLDGFASDKVQLNGSAKTVPWGDYGAQQSQVSQSEQRQKLRLTDDYGQAGSAFIKDALPLSDGAGGTRKTSFSTFMQVQMHGNDGMGDGDGTGADGITFAIASDAKTLGNTGGGMGIHGSKEAMGARSVVVELDTYDNNSLQPIRAGHPDGVESGNHIAIKIDGADDSVVRVDIPERLNDGRVWAMWVDYDGDKGVLEVRLQRGEAAQVWEKPKQVALAYKIDLAATVGESAHLGFTGGTGGGKAFQDVFNLDVKARIPTDD